MKRAHFLLLMIFMGGLGAASVHGQLEGSTPFSTAGTTAEEVKAFLANLQKLVVADKREAVAALVDYPISAWAGGKSVKVRNKKELVAKYEAIFTPELKETIAKASVETTWCNYKGVMIESGRIWFGPTGDDNKMRIITINEPVGGKQ